VPPLKSILVMADRSADAQVALQKAFVIARHFDAGIELVACDADQAWTARTASRPEEGARARVARSAESRRFLEALRSTIVVDDLQIRTGEDCEEPLHEGLPRRVRAGGHHLVVKRLPRREVRRRSVLTPGDWQVIRACPVPIMLTRGRPWRPLPRIVASLDGARTGEVVDVARYLADGCRGALEVVPADEPRAIAADGGEADPAAMLLARPAHQEIDVVVLRGCGHRPEQDRACAALTERIVEQLDCDVLLMPGPGVAH
jgi:universal stress protein E